MEESDRLPPRFYLWSIFLVILASFAFDRFFSAFPGKFVSPIVFGQAAQVREPRRSPFAFLFGRPAVPARGGILGLRSGEGSTRKPVVPASPGSPGSVSGSLLGSPSNSAVSSSTRATDSLGSSSLPITATPTPTPSASSNIAPTSSQQAVGDTSNLVISLLVSGRYENLYNLMSLEFKNTFSLEDFVASFTGSAKVLSGSTTALAKIYGPSGEWAEQPVVLNLADGGTQKYLDIYHLENGSWTLFATEDQ